MRTFTKADARLIAEAAAECADKACEWKARALAAEEALSKFAAEIYGNKPALSEQEGQPCNCGSVEFGVGAHWPGGRFGKVTCSSCGSEQEGK